MFTVFPAVSHLCMETEVLQVQKVMVCDFRYFWWTSICFVCLICVSKFIACDCFLLIDGNTKFNYNARWLNNNNNNNDNNLYTGSSLHKD